TPALSGVPSGISSFTGTAQAAPPLGRVAPSAQPPVGALPVQLPQAAAALIPPAPVPQTSLLPNNVNIPRGVTVDEIRFGIAAPFSGATKELGHHMRLGIETGFSEANANGGVNGRMLRLIAADDGYEPTRTADAMKQLYETDQVFGTIGNV